MSAIRDLAGNCRRSTVSRGMIRIPAELDVPLTDRVRALIDTAEFRRLARISQLGLVATGLSGGHPHAFRALAGRLSPGAVVSAAISYDAAFRRRLVTLADAELLIAAALLHDLGHWPFCHPIEDMRLPSVPQHELFANSFLLEGEIADALRDDWAIQPRDVVALLSRQAARRQARGLLASMLSGPIDIDKMDYLARDSLHAGVPYGRNFDQGRLIGSLCLNAQRQRHWPSRDKGKTAAEMMVFARYVMFSEVYWHHGVRSATAMLQRAFYLLHGQLDLDALFRLTEAPMIAAHAAGGRRAARPRDLLDGLVRPAPPDVQAAGAVQRVRRAAIYAGVARRPYPWLAACASSSRNWPARP